MGVQQIFFIILLQVALSVQAQPITTKKNPNIIFILADDLGYGDVSAYNSQSKIQTPNIDFLCNNGIMFTNAHSPSAVCTPSRYSILTGRYPFRSRLKAGVLWSYDWPLIDDTTYTVGEFLQDNGYQTAIIGKWHLGWQYPVKKDAQIDTTRYHFRNLQQSLEREQKIDFTQPFRSGPLSCGFDYQFGVDIPSLPPFAFIENGRIVGPLPDRLTPDTMAGLKGMMQPNWDSHKILPTLIDTALSYISTQSKKNDPFFLYLPLTVPHYPIAPNKAYKGKSGDGDYGDVVVEMDDYIGRINTLLKQLNIDENTIIIFSSDNGSTMDAGDPYLTNPAWAEYGAGYKIFGHLSNGLFKGIKGDIWEGGHRVPLTVYWPGRIKPGRINDQAIGLTDFFATCAGIINSSIPKGTAIDSYDFSNTLFSDTPVTTERENIVFHSSKGCLSIEKKEWKLIACNNSGGGLRNKYIPNDQVFETPGQLYNMHNDPYEKENVYNQYPQIVEELTKELNLLKAETP